MISRSQAVASIRNSSFDVCVIGGGATGAGCALDAELRGFKTVLLEASDFASATSSASTKLVHGGLRYLQQAVMGCDLGQYHVVRRALRERRLMLENAPFLARPLELLVPCFRRRDLCYFRAGLKLYDWIAGKDRLAPSRYLTAEETSARLPLLNASKLVGAIAYTDGQFDDARYGLTLVKTFVEHGGCALNYARVVDFTRSSDGKLREALVEDRISRERFSVSARVFLNATGPFSDQLRKLAHPGAPARLRLSKGIHILLPLEPSHMDAMLVPQTDDGRVIFAIPWQGRLLVGTTDDETTLEEELAAKRPEVEYLLRHLNRYLQTPCSIGQVVSATAGLRPLVSHGEARSSSKLIRDHEVELDLESGLISILGGKWTTYRAMAEDAIDAAQQYLRTAACPFTPAPATATFAGGPRPFSSASPTPTAGNPGTCMTRHFPLVGSEGWEPAFWQTLVSSYRIPPETARHLAGKFGTRAVEVLEFAGADRKLAAPIIPGATAIQAEIVYGIRCEMATSIEDVLARRIGLQWFSWRSALAAASLVGAYLAQERGWSAGETEQAIREYTLRVMHLSAMAGLSCERALTG
ncbi:MAG: glycerol-3-phosphate dehydrogenase/oxidase [Candidatus Korobacteraceae bacterium]|jgi:glycerol-3-phosphate dehydrogenase